MKADTWQKIISTILFLACLSGLIFKVQECIRKFVSNPQSVDISLVKQTMIEFPTLTFCPQMYMVHNEGFYPEAYNFSSMKNCGLKFPEFESEHWALPWIGNCTKDYKNFWKSIENKWEDFKVNYIKIQSSLDYLMLSKLTPTPFYSHLHGVCYSWEVPRDVIEKGIQYIEISAGHKADFVIFFHSKGLLNNNPRMSLEYAIINMISKSIITVNLNFKQLENLDYNGEKCEQNPNYDFNKCLNEEIFNESMKILNCTTPYGPNKDHICDSTDLANQAIGIYSRKNLNYICLHPCKIIGEFDSDVWIKQESHFHSSEAFIFFKKYIARNESKYSYTELDLLAAIGGYFGLFLGFSIFHLRDFVLYLIAKFK